MHELRAICRQCGKSVVLLLNLSSPSKLVCNFCNSDIVEITPIAGFVYILSNSCMPGLVKIGHTTRDVESRVDELSSATGVPERFRIEASLHSKNPGADEATIHEILRAEKHCDSREFFKIDVTLAIKVVESVTGGEPFLLRSIPQSGDRNNTRPYAFQCHGCGKTFRSACPRDAGTICPFCYSKNFS